MRDHAIVILHVMTFYDEEQMRTNEQNLLRQQQLVQDMERKILKYREEYALTKQTIAYHNT